MKKIKILIAKILVSNHFLWLLVKPIAFLGVHLQIKRNQFFDDLVLSESNVLKIFSSLTVLNGPFRGLKYPRLMARGSAIYPKLLGSYESELHGVIHSILLKSYRIIIDVGCAEGYYAIGLAKSFPKAQIFAYDTDIESRQLCIQMGRLNHIPDDLLQVLPYCSAEDLNNFDFEGGGLIISDCEGFEKHLFDTSNVNNLINCDLLIEVHDCIDITISCYLKKLFLDSHLLTIVKSVDDIEKAKVYDFGIKDLPIHVKQILFRERVGIMEWYYFSRK